MSTEHPKINPKCRDEKVLLQAASLCTNPQHNRGLCKCGGLTLDKKLHKICSACNKMQFSLPKPILRAHLFHFFPYFCICPLQDFLCLLHYPKCYFLSGREPIWCFLKTSHDLVLLHGILSAPWNPFLLHVSDPPQTGSDENNLNPALQRVGCISYSLSPGLEFLLFSLVHS